MGLKEKLEKEIIELSKAEKNRREMSNELGFRLLVYGILYGIQEKDKNSI